MSEDRPADIERLLAALLEVSQKAAALAVEVRQSLRADRQVGRSGRPASGTTAEARQRVRRRKPDRRKV